MIKDEIKKDNLQAMKDKNTLARNCYGVLLNKIMLEEIKKRETNEELTDADVSNIIQKMLKELKDEQENYAKVNNAQAVEETIAQQQLISKYLPKMLSKDEIKEIILAQPDHSIPYIMKLFKAEYNGKCDMREVQEVLKNL